MNNISPGTLNARELASLRVDVAGLVQDADTGVAIQIQRQGNRSFNPATGTTGYAETTTEVTAHRSIVLEDEGAVRKGDVRWIVVAASLTAIPQPDDRILEGSVAWSVYRVDNDPISATYVLFSRRA